MPLPRYGAVARLPNTSIQYTVCTSLHMEHEALPASQPGLEHLSHSRAPWKEADCSPSSLLPAGGFPALAPEGNVWLL